MLRGRWGVRDGLWAMTQSVVWRQAGGKGRRVGEIDPVRRRSHVFNGEHYWVLGEDGLEAEDFRKTARGCGFTVTRDFRPAGAVSHHFFVLETASAPPW